MQTFAQFFAELGMHSSESLVDVTSALEGTEVCLLFGLVVSEDVPETQLQTAGELTKAAGVLRPRVSKKLIVFGLAVLAVFLFAAFAGRMLVSDSPERSDAIVVLAGDSQDERYRHGMELLRAGYGKHLFLDASSDSRYFGHTPAEYAQAFL